MASKINGIYTAAQDKVKKRLADLETQSMKRFDDGNAKATQGNSRTTSTARLDAFKDDRYSGWFGWARKAKDWLQRHGRAARRSRRSSIATAQSLSRTINKLVEDISADNKRVIQECKDELASAREGNQGIRRQARTRA